MTIDEMKRQVAFLQNEIAKQEKQEADEKARVKRKIETQRVMRGLDCEIWKQFHPDDTLVDEPAFEIASMWLRTDIVTILTKSVNSEYAKAYIVEKIDKSGYGAEIREALCWDDLLKEVEVRRDFATALKAVKKGNELSGILDYSFDKEDIEELATLHKSGKFRKKIENLLTDCNFHHECSLMHAKRYDELCIA